jgi:spore maturation protein CgeB
MNACTDQGRIQVLVAGASPESADGGATRRLDVVEGFAEVLGASAVATCRYEQAARHIERLRPELVFVIGSCLEDRCDYARIRKTCDAANSQLAFWLENDPHEFDASVKMCALADFIFSNDRFASAHYAHPRAFHLPPAASARRFGQLSPVPWKDRTSDVFFCGTAFPNRTALVADLAVSLGRKQTKICGTGWDEPKLSFCRDQRIDASDLPAAYAQARVVLAMSRTGSSANKRCLLDPSTPGASLFEAAMAGCCQLLFADSLEMLDYFDRGREILLFDGTSDFAAQLERLLSNGELASSIGSAARRRALADHTYAARARRVLECTGLAPSATPRPRISIPVAANLARAA